MNSRSSPPWRTLDNAAKIFPSTGSSHDSKVFRFVCELREPVEPQLLQAALDKALDRFPMYRSVMKRGWFWYYLEESPLWEVDFSWEGFQWLVPDDNQNNVVVFLRRDKAGRELV